MPRRKNKKPDPKLRSPWIVNQGHKPLVGSNHLDQVITSPPIESQPSQVCETDCQERLSRKKNECLLIDLPKELQVRILTYLRANCLGRLQQTCTWFNSSELVHSIVAHAAEFVYPPEMTSGFEKQPVGIYDKIDQKKVRSCSKEGVVEVQYTFEHMRNMELLVIARVLSSPEPSVGFVVSKSWCKTALKWLEEQEVRLYRSSTIDVDKKKSKGAKKANRMQQKRTNETVVLCPNVNFDITCPHDQLQHLSSSKSARSRRRLLDKKAWKILKTLYPESTPLESVYGECFQCRLDEEKLRKNEADIKENEKALRKLPLANVELRRFYTRTRGVPEHCLRPVSGHENLSRNTVTRNGSGSFDDEEDKKFPAAVGSQKSSSTDFSKTCAFCPLLNGSYYILPRSWCHGWRRYMKTGEGSQLMRGNCPQKVYGEANKNTCAFPPPDAAVLLCDAHNMALLPPHLMSYLFDDISGEERETTNSVTPICHATTKGTVIIGERPVDDTVEAMKAAGLSDLEVDIQLSAMRALEENRRRSLEQQDDYYEDASSPPTSRSRSGSFNNQQNETSTSRPRSGSFGQNELLSPLPCKPRSGSFSNSELLDRENHSVVEILTKDEYRALEKCWPGTTLFSIRFSVSDTRIANSKGFHDSMTVHFNTPVCRECDATGRQCSVVIKNRSRGWLKKSSEKARAPASLEY